MTTNHSEPVTASPTVDQQHATTLYSSRVGARIVLPVLFLLACRVEISDPWDPSDGSGVLITGNETVAMDDSSISGATMGTSTDPAEDESSGGPPEWGECHSQADVETCAEACTLEGKTCHENGCGDGSTVRGYTFGGCTLQQGDSEIGCDESIVSEVLANTVRCCCR